MLRILVIVIAVVLAAVRTAAGQSNPAAFVFPTAEVAGRFDDAAALQSALLDDAADGRLDRHSFLDAALIAGSRCTPRDLETFRRRFEHLVAELQVSGRVVGTLADRTRAIHEFVHARVLTGGFQAESTTLHEVLDLGRFNCISSVILFRLFAERFGVPVYGVEVPGHAYAVIDDGGAGIELQTTCPQWFAVDGDRTARQAMLRSIVGDVASADNGQLRRLTDLGLLAVVYYNRGVDEIESGRYAESLAANRNALTLDPANPAARANLLAAVNNWSLTLSRRGDVRQAVSLLETGLAQAPDYELFYENLVALHQQSLAEPGSLDERSEHAVALRACYDRWQSELARRGAALKAADIARRAAADPFLVP